MSQPIIIRTTSSSSKTKSSSSCCFKLSSIPRLLFRLTVYPVILLHIYVYIRVKAEDPNGFKRIRNAFTFGEKEPLNSFDFSNIDIKERMFGDEESTVGVNSKIIPNLKQQKKSTGKVFLPEEIIKLRNRLIDESIQCRKLKLLLTENKINFEPMDCYNDFAYYERILNREVAQNALVHSVQVLEIFKKIHEVFTKHPDNDPYYAKFINNCGSVCEESDEINDKLVDMTKIKTEIDKTLSIVSNYLKHFHSKYDPDYADRVVGNEVNFDYVTEEIHDQSLSFIDTNYPLISRAVKFTPKIVEDLPSELAVNIKTLNSK